MLSSAATVCLLSFVLLFAIITVVVLLVVAIALVKIGRQLDKWTGIVEPVATKAADTLDSLRKVTENVGEKADHILARGETLTENVSVNVEQTATVVQQAVTTPLIRMSSLLAGITKGFTVYATNRKSRG